MGAKALQSRGNPTISGIPAIFRSLSQGAGRCKEMHEKAPKTRFLSKSLSKSLSLALSSTLKSVDVLRAPRRQFIRGQGTERNRDRSPYGYPPGSQPNGISAHDLADSGSHPVEAEERLSHAVENKEPPA